LQFALKHHLSQETRGANRKGYALVISFPYSNSGWMQVLPRMPAGVDETHHPPLAMACNPKREAICVLDIPDRFLQGAFAVQGVGWYVLHPCRLNA
jgi:hypothetical protein